MSTRSDRARRTTLCLGSMILLLALVGCGPSNAEAEYRCPMHPDVVAQSQGDCPICGMKLVVATQKAGAAGAAKGQAQLFVCPMHPEVTSAKPSDCPICGMALVERKEESPNPASSAAPAGLASVTVPAAKRQMLGMTTGEVATRPFARHIRAAARISVDESRLFRVTIPAEGWVDKLYVQGVGDAVQKGQPLLELYSIEALSALRRDLATLGRASSLGPPPDANTALRGSADAAGQTFEFLRDRVRRWGLSDDQIAAFTERPNDLRSLTLYATVSGSIAEKTVVTGQRLEAGDQLFVLADLSRVWAEADLTASDGPLIQKGATVAIEVPSLPGRSFSGRVAALAPFLDGQTRTQRVRIELANPELVLRPGLPAVATISVDLGMRLAVPSSAVLRTGERAYAFRLADGDRLEPVAVRTGIADDQSVEVLEGLSAGDRVVTSATFLIDSESAMTAALRAVSER
jgi:membrane fusion protein, copper/silver efflux system